MVAIPEIDKFRFFVIDEENKCRSAVWFVRSQGDHVYVSPRNLGSSYKLSLHPRNQSRDGCDCQLGTSATSKDAEIAAGFRPVPLIRWRRRETPSMGAAPIARILFPTDLLTESAQPEGDGKTKFALPLAPPGQALEISILYSLEHPDDLESKFIARGMTPMLYLGLSNGEFVNFTAQHVPFNGLSKEDFYRAAGHAQPLKGAPKPGDSVKHARGILSAGRPEEGQPLLLIDVGAFSVTRATA